MNLEDFIKNMSPQMLQNAMQQMGNMLSPEQMKQVRQAIQTTDKGALNQKLNHLSKEDFERELKKNPNLAKQLANNKEVMAKINQLFRNPS